MGVCTLVMDSRRNAEGIPTRHYANTLLYITCYCCCCCLTPHALRTAHHTIPYPCGCVWVWGSSLRATEYYSC